MILPTVVTAAARSGAIFRSANPMCSDPMLRPVP